MFSPVTSHSCLTGRSLANCKHIYIGASSISVASYLCHLSPFSPLLFFCLARDSTLSLILKNKMKLCMQLTAFECKQQFIFMRFVVKQIACLFVCLFVHTDSQINGKVPQFTCLGFIHEDAITASQTPGRERWGGPFPLTRVGVSLRSAGLERARLIQANKNSLEYRKGNEYVNKRYLFEAQVG